MATGKYDKAVPEKYARPTGPTNPKTWVYWLELREDDAATATYDVLASVHGEQHIVAQKCYLHWGITIVSALRALAQPAE